MTENALEPLRHGREALGRRDWESAYELLSAADAADGLAASDLEGLAEAAHWSGHLDACFDATERAHGKYVEASDWRGGAATALELVHLYANKGATSVAAGWLGTAQRLLVDQPESAEHGRLSATLSFISLYIVQNFDLALEEAERTFDLGCRLGDRDLQATGLSFRGQTLVRIGRMSEGLALIDEAMAAAVSGQLSPVVSTLMYCYMLTTCAILADYRRGAEWCEAAGRCDARLGIAGRARFSGDCRSHHAGVLRGRGDWSAAEEEAARACDELRDGYQHAHMGMANSEVALIRLRRGDLVAAEQAFGGGVEDGGFLEMGLGPYPNSGLALLRLAQGRLDAAAVAIDDALSAYPGDGLARAFLLPAQVEIAIARSDVETARSATDELAAIASTFPTAALRATAATAAGALALASDDPSSARDHLRGACQLWKDAGVPYDGARARVSLAEAFRALGDPARAALELRDARSVFVRLDAKPDVERVDALLSPAATPVHPRVTTLLFTDIVRSTELVEALGDEAWADVLQWHDSTLRALFSEHGGEEVKHLGDGFFVAFVDSRAAIECAVAIQRGLAEHRRAHGFAPAVRIGLHRETALQRGADLHGKAVHLAARIAALAEGGQILATEDTADGCAMPTVPSCMVTLKGVKQPVAVVAIEWAAKD